MTGKVIQVIYKECCHIFCQWKANIPQLDVKVYFYSKLSVTYKVFWVELTKPNLMLQTFSPPGRVFPFLSFCYLMALSVFRLYSIIDRMINEYGAVGGMRIGGGNQSTW
jgi:hypothetical protein